MKRTWRFSSLAAALALACYIGVSAAAAQLSTTAPTSEEIPEYVVKAGFLFNLAKYVEWPGPAFATPDAPIRIGIVGEDPFGVTLDQVLANKIVNDRHFEIHRFGEVTDIRDVHILFVPRSEGNDMTQILSQIGKLPVLTVGEQVSFAARGGMIAITIEAHRPSLHINRGAVERHELALDSKLLRVAQIVSPER